MPRLHRHHLLTATVLAASLVVAGCGRGDAPPAAGGSTAVPPTGGAPTTTVAVAKDVLATTADPPGAPGRTLTLIRYTIAPGAKLTPHIHPGIQLAAIDTGTLTYTVESGTATVTRAGGDTEAVTGPATITLGPGDSVAEPDGMVHFGANDTTTPVVILATLLTEDGRDLAVTVTTAGPATTR
ncbi:MAG: cupin domain-containing protein [Acidimicrobiales bacterium]